VAEEDFVGVVGVCLDIVEGGHDVLLLVVVSGGGGALEIALAGEPEEVVEEVGAAAGDARDVGHGRAEMGETAGDEAAFAVADDEDGLVVGFGLDNGGEGGGPAVQGVLLAELLAAGGTVVAEVRDSGFFDDEEAGFAVAGGDDGARAIAEGGAALPLGEDGFRARALDEDHERLGLVLVEGGVVGDGAVEGVFAGFGFEGSGHLGEGEQARDDREHRELICSGAGGGSLVFLGIGGCLPSNAVYVWFTKRTRRAQRAGRFVGWASSAETPTQPPLGKGRSRLGGF
jgi:hypothetical protein